MASRSDASDTSKSYGRTPGGASRREAVEARGKAGAREAGEAGGSCA